MAIQVDGLLVAVNELVMMENDGNTVVSVDTFPLLAHHQALLQSLTLPEVVVFVSDMFRWVNELCKDAYLGVIAHTELAAWHQILLCAQNKSISYQ